MEEITKRSIKEVAALVIIFFTILFIVLVGSDESEAAVYGEPWYDPYVQSHDSETRSFSDAVARDAYINETWSERYEAQDRAIKLDRIEQRQRLNRVLDAIGQ